MLLRGMDQNSFFLDAIDREAIKVWPSPTIKTAFLVMALRQKLPKLWSANPEIDFNKIFLRLLQGVGGV